MVVYNRWQERSARRDAQKAFPSTHSDVLLDEVDAPLDDSNTVRFCELVRKMSAQTQFLFISHNKITMELAEQLIGVTMPEPGVSRIVEVDIEAAMELARKQAA